jgi:hypothetical protein
LKLLCSVGNGGVAFEFRGRAKRGSLAAGVTRTLLSGTGARLSRHELRNALREEPAQITVFTIIMVEKARDIVQKENRHATLEEERDIATLLAMAAFACLTLLNVPL